MDLNKGLPLPENKSVFCGQNHSYVKAPIEGWRGIKKGDIRIGQEITSFKDWLDGLKDERWPKAWELFWKHERSLPMFGAIGM
jgi:hypothetical protein